MTLRLGRPAIRFVCTQRSSLALRPLQQSSPLAFSFRCQSTGTTTSTAKVSPKEEAVYYGPLTPTFRRLKIFSLSSLALSFAFAPFIFLIESHLPLAARIALAATALATSGGSTALVARCSSPYVTSLRRLRPLESGQGLEITTLTLFLHERVTRVYDSEFVVDTTRFFARWQLAEDVALPSKRAGRDSVLPGLTETVAETFDDKGGVVGRWIVTWGEHGGKCRAVGNVVQYFNVHDDLLR